MFHNLKLISERRPVVGRGTAPAPRIIPNKINFTPEERFMKKHMYGNEIFPVPFKLLCTYLIYPDIRRK